MAFEGFLLHDTLMPPNKRERIVLKCEIKLLDQNEKNSIFQNIKDFCMKFQLTNERT